MGEPEERRENGLELPGGMRFDDTTGHGVGLVSVRVGRAAFDGILVASFEYSGFTVEFEDEFSFNDFESFIVVGVDVFGRTFVSRRIDTDAAFCRTSSVGESTGSVMPSPVGLPSISCRPKVTVTEESDSPCSPPEAFVCPDMRWYNS